MFSRPFYRLAYLSYRYIYAPLGTMYFRLKDPEKWNRPLPPMVCQICGKSAIWKDIAPIGRNMDYRLIIVNSNNIFAKNVTHFEKIIKC